MQGYIIEYAETLKTLKITEVEDKDYLLTFEMRVVRGIYDPTPTKG